MDELTLEQKFTEKIIEMLTKGCKPEELSKALSEIARAHFYHFPDES